MTMHASIAANGPQKSHFAFTTGTAGTLAISAGIGGPITIDEITPTNITFGGTEHNLFNLSINEVSTQPGKVALAIDIRNDEWASCIVRIPGAPDQSIPRNSSYKLVYINRDKGPVLADDKSEEPIQEFKFDVTCEKL
jgi:hypothetical protein